MRKDQGYYIEREHAKEINLRDFFDIMKNGMWIILLVATLSTTAGYFLTDNDTLLYETETRIIIESDGGYMQTLMVMIKDPLVMSEVQENVGLNRSPESIAGQVDVMRIDDSQVVKITVTDQDPQIAAVIANEVATTFKSKALDILEFEDVQLLSDAKENHIPINGGNQNRKIILALFVGGFVGISLVFILNSLDDTIKKEREVEAILGVPVLGVVSKIKVRHTKRERALQNHGKIEIGSDIGDLK